jgi:nucleoside-diphosphate-sugar epimerase
MDILVTGGTVFASRYTAEFFASSGHNVFVLNRGTRPQPPNVTLIKGDRHCSGELLRNRHFDAVIDVTAYNSDDVNGLLDSLGSFDRYVLISSSAVYPETLPQPFKEEQVCGANSIWGAYGTNKIAAEKALLSRVPDAYILRPPYLYGPMNNLWREAFVFECADNDRPFYVPKDGSMPLQFLHIGDMCRFIAKILEIMPPEHIFNVGNSSTISIIQWVKACYSVTGRTPEFRFVSGNVPQRSYFPFYDYSYILDVTKMCRYMYCFTPIKEGLESSYEWYRNNRELIIRKPLAEFIANELEGSADVKFQN